MEKQKLSVKMGLPYSEAVAYMKALVESLDCGRIVVESGEECICLVPSEHIDIKIEAKIKKDKQKISFEMSWAEKGDADLKIGSKVPEDTALPTEMDATEPAENPVASQVQDDIAETAPETAEAAAQKNGESSIKGKSAVARKKTAAKKKRK